MNKKMNPKVKELWLTALRSGDYARAEGKLSDGIGYCCLGVLCDIASKQGLGRWDSDLDFYRRYVDIGGDYSQATLTEGVKEWSGLSDYVGRFESGGGHAMSLAAMNDGGASFAMLADTIERYF